MAHEVESPVLFARQNEMILGAIAVGTTQDRGEGPSITTGRKLSMIETAYQLSLCTTRFNLSQICLDH